MARGTALIIANSEYGDPRLRKLRAPARDADALARVLAEPTVGDFDVDVSSNEPEHVLRRRLARFFADRGRDELLLLHVSCHGLKDDAGHLYFAAADTEVDALDATAVSAEYLNRQMTRSRSRRIVLLLDCCYSGAFARGMTPRAGDVVDVKERFEGRGRAVITASSAVEYSFEGDAVSGRGSPSVFTSAVVKALETGAADRDRDGWISVGELYEYVYDEISEVTADQRPRMWLFDVEGDLRIARGPGAGAVDEPARRPPAPSRSATRRRPRGWIAALIGGLVALAAVSAAVAILDDGDSGTPGEGPGGRAAAAVVNTVDVGTRPFAVAADLDNYSIWVGDVSDGTIHRVDTGSNGVEGEPLAVGEAFSLVVGEGSVWVPSRQAGTVTRLRLARTIQEAATITVGPGAYAVAVAAGTAWVVDADDDRVARIDTRANRVQGQPVDVGRAPRGVAADAAGAWVTNSGSDSVTYVDRTGRVRHRSIAVGAEPNGIAILDGVVWVANAGSDSVTRIDAASGKVLGEPISVGRRPLGVAAGGGSVWVTCSADNAVWRLDPTSGRRRGDPVPVGRTPAGITVADDRVWVANSDDGTVSEVEF